jgi:hypothetical protein
MTLRAWIQEEIFMRIHADLDHVPSRKYCFDAVYYFKLPNGVELRYPSTSLRPVSKHLIVLIPA